MNLNEDVDIARRDLKSAMEEIERQSFDRHGLERENTALRAQVEDFETSRSELDALAKQWYRYYREQVEKNAALLAMLKRLQWAAENYEEPACPICWCEEPIHEDDCALAALLKGEEHAPVTKTV